MAGRSSQLALALICLSALLAPRAGAVQLVGPFAKSEYPQAVIDRPLTLPAGMVEVEVGGTFVSQRFDGSFFGVSGTDDWLADVAVRVGVTDRIQIEAGTAFSLDHTVRGDTGYQGSRFDFRPNLTSWQRVVPFRLSFLALDTEPLDTAMTLTLPFVAHASRVTEPSRFLNPIKLQNSDGRVLPAVELAAPTRWRLTDWLWLRAGENLFAVTTAQGVARFAFDFGVGVQPHQLLAVTLDSRIATIAFDGSGNEASQTLRDVGTIALEATFSPLSCLDLVGGFDLPDVGRGTDAYALRSAVRVRF
jgi:hypothetical protein